ncbi:MAG: ABC transporter ATP-binding protein [Oscillospiraceae bacterium]|nr:ABC transporter ATP-binding protein [Oscillospiraceae bacterium]
MVKIDNLIKRYGDFTLDISMEIPRGKVTGLVGRNGAGKTTTIKALLGLIKTDGGSVTVMGRDAAELTAEDRKRIGAALSESGFSGLLRVKDVADILAAMYDDADRDSFLGLCKKFGLPEDKPIKEFSTGMKAKLRVLTALSHRSDLLIMDEPTAGLDVEARNEILDMLRDYLTGNEDCSILISSHISSDLENLCDDIYLINNGKIILHEDTDRLLDSYGVMRVDEETYGTLDKQHILAVRKENFGYSCFADDRRYYEENCPGLVIQKGSIDDLILIMAGGELL